MKMFTVKQHRGQVRRFRDESGQALIEFAFVIIMLLVMVVAVVDFARVFLQYQVVTDAAREGARQAVVFEDPPLTADSITTVVLSALSLGGVDVSSWTRTEDCERPSGSVEVVTLYSCRWESSTSGDEVRVGIAVPYEFSILGPFIGWTTGDRRITLRTSIAMRNE